MSQKKLIKIYPQIYKKGALNSVINFFQKIKLV